MNKVFINLIILVIILFGCTKREGERKTNLLSHFLSISDTEDAGVKDVLAFYGGECLYSIGKSVATDEDSKHFFELRVSKSKALDDYAESPKFPASNIAYRFYRNLSNEEKEKYTHIKTVIVFSDGREKSFEFATEELKVVEERMTSVKKVIQILKNKSYEDLRPILNDSSIAEYDRDQLIENLKKVEPTLGEITDEGFRLFGYKIGKLYNQNKILLAISGVMIRDIQANEFTIVVDPYSTKDEILLLNYELLK